MDLLAPNIQHYHWGDYAFIPELQDDLKEMNLRQNSGWGLTQYHQAEQ